MGTLSDFERQLFDRSPKSFGEWHAIDLHNHSPSSFDYTGNQERAIEDTAKRIIETNLSIVMFTDHGKLPDEKFIDDVARRTGKTILRGVELNVFVDAWTKPEGKVDKSLYFHLLVGFDPDAKRSPEYWLSNIYEKCGDETRSSSNMQIRGVTAGIDGVMEALKGSNAIVIPAHLHSSRDAFRSRSVDDIYADGQFLRFARQHFSALEVTDKKTATYFDGTRAETQMLEKACVQSSDAHDAGALGTRVSYALMQEPTFEELKAALGVSFRISLSPANRPASHIIGLHIHGNFYQDLWLTLSPHCNALIGVKGSGKTSVLEALRYALGALVPTSRQEAVNSHLQAILGASGRVRVLIKRSDGAKVLVERTLLSSNISMTFEDDRQETLNNVEGLLFPCYILGWHEIEQAATDITIRQGYLDTIAGRELMRSLREAASLAAKSILHEHEIAATKYNTYRALTEQIASLEELRKGLQELTDDNLIALRNEYEAAVRHRDAIDGLTKALRGANDELQNRVSALRIEFNPGDADENSPIKELADEGVSLVSMLGSDLDHFAESYREGIGQIANKVTELLRKSEDRFADFVSEYEKRLAVLPPEKRRLLETHRRVMDDTKALPRLRSEQETHRRDLEGVLRGLASLSEEVAKLLDSRTERRQQRVEALNAELRRFDVQLAVEPLVGRGRFDALRQQYGVGARVFDGVNSLTPNERRYHRRLAAVYRALHDDLQSGAKLVFDSPEFNFFVDCFEEDDLKIGFRLDKGGNEYRPIDQMSAGQRCTAVFPLLLRLQEGPLIIDQPEDNLDNRHIADAIAPALRQDKQSRQIAFTSHNANLVVLTDAEHIARFESTGTAGKVENRGFLCASHSPIANDVIAILDGGETALRMRYNKYGMGDGPR